MLPTGLITQASGSEHFQWTIPDTTNTDAKYTLRAVLAVPNVIATYAQPASAEIICGGIADPECDDAVAIYIGSEVPSPGVQYSRDVPCQQASG
jgi:hypothetical protein